MKRHIILGALFAASVLIGWWLGRAGGTDGLLIYAGAVVPVLMAAMWAWDGRCRRHEDTPSAPTETAPDR